MNEHQSSPIDFNKRSRAIAASKTASAASMDFEKGIRQMARSDIGAQRWLEQLRR
jgi:hypothetical protein